MNEIPASIDPAPLLAAWNLTLEAVRPARQKAQIFDVRRQDGTLAILKVYRDDTMGYEAESPEFLRAMAGDHCVRLVESRPRAILMEFAEGTMLFHRAVNGDENGAIDRIVQVGEAIRRKRNLYTPKRTLKQRFWNVLYAETGNHRLLLSDSFASARAISRTALEQDADADRGMIHGDLHHGNIIESPKGALLAIDPLTIYGEPEAEYCQALCNPRTPKRPRTVEQVLSAVARIETQTGLDPRRMVAWGVAAAANLLIVQVKRRGSDTRKIEFEARQVEMLLQAYEEILRR